MMSSLPDELVEDILVRLSSDNPADLLRTSLICKDWRRVLSDRGSFLRRFRRLHGAAMPPPLLGYIQNRYFKGSSMQCVVPAADAASPVGMPAAVNYSSCVALDCRHDRVLIHFVDASSERGLLIWDPIIGSQQHLSVPSADYPSYKFRHSYTGVVLCAKDGCDYRLDCRDGPFYVVFVETNLESPIFACATTYSSMAGTWSSPTPSHITFNMYYRYSGGRKPSLVIGDVIYFIFEHNTSILKYDLRTHWLSEIKMSQATSQAVLMKAEDGGPGLVTLTNNSIHMWSRRDVVAANVIVDRWVKHKGMKLGKTSLPIRGVPCNSCQVVGFAEDTNTVFIKISTTIFTLDLKLKKVRRVGEREDNRFDLVLPYMSFYTPRYSSCGFF